MPVASAAGNYWGGDRPGNNLFAGSLVCVDARTGKRVWHQQLVRHDISADEVRRRRPHALVLSGGDHLTFVRDPISAVLIAGIGTWWLFRALVQTGVLAQFPSGRTQQRV